MVLIEGTAFPLDTINNNGWGIPSTEADNAINTLKNAVIRICPRNQPHGCDFSDDPFSEIGHIADAWKQDNEIRVVANITDSIASQKIQDQTWSNGWSIYSHYQNESDGWLSGVDIKSLTLVKDPAWDKSTWTKAASSDETSSLLFYKPFKILVGNTMTETTPTPGGGGIPAEYDALLKEKESIINELTTNKSSMETEFQALKEQFESVNAELTTLKQAAASKDVELSKSITLDEADKRIAAALDKYKEDIARNEALNRLAAARKSRGYETSFEEYAKDPVSRITKLAEDFENMKSASKEPVYPSSTSTSGGFTVGNKNSGKWEA